MKYKINGHELDSLKRSLTCEGDQQKIRPKTLDMLLFFIAHQGQVITKSQLLKAIWHDTTVNEGVVFQSITEIRKLFRDNDIIINHSRRGYQLNAEVECISARPVAQKTSPFYALTSSKWRLMSIVLFLAILIALFQLETKTSSPPEKTLILPVENQIRYEHFGWLPLGGMDYLIRQMSTDSALYWFSVEEVLQIMSRLDNTILTRADKIASLFKTSNATHIVHTSIKGESPDFTLAMTVYGRNGSVDFVIMSDSINNALQQASIALAKHFSLSPSDKSYEPEKAFKNSLFTKAILSYETDWDTAVHYLKSYLDTDPDSVIATRYLAKLLVWKNDISGAERLLERLEFLAPTQSQDLAYVYYLRGLVARKQANSQMAMQWFEQASETINHHSHSLFAVRIVDSTAGVLMDNGEYQKAITHFHTALQLYESVNNLVGINSVKLQLAKAYHLTGQEPLANQYFNDAEQQVSELKIAFLHQVLSETREALNTP